MDIRGLPVRDTQVTAYDPCQQRWRQRRRRQLQRTLSGNKAGVPCHAKHKASIAAPIPTHTLLWYPVTADGVDKTSLQHWCTPPSFFSPFGSASRHSPPGHFSIAGFPNPATPEAASSPPAAAAVRLDRLGCRLSCHPSFQFSRIYGAESASFQPPTKPHLPIYLRIPLYAHRWRLALEALTNPPAPQQHCEQP
ncbi:hypothetical protein CGRA01v4_06291 [Colletotrichum graminicola]|nr:hypothetical protein CGRA01v4_06291 [Colletotrichum graminicola]